MKSLQQYLQDGLDKGIIDHRIRAHQDTESGAITFYVHADGHDSDTLDFIVTENALELVPNTDPSAKPD